MSRVKIMKSRDPNRGSPVAGILLNSLNRPPPSQVKSWRLDLIFPLDKPSNSLQIGRGVYPVFMTRRRTRGRVGFECLEKSLESRLTSWNGESNYERLPRAGHGQNMHNSGDGLHLHQPSRRGMPPPWDLPNCFGCVRAGLDRRGPDGGVAKDEAESST
jgi:hypothetical protein